MRSDLIAYIDTDRIVHNVRALRACCRRGVKLCAPLKADAYGHGVAQVAPALQAAGVDMAAVATIPEAIELRQLGWRRPILVFSNALAVGDEAERRDRLDALRDYRLTQTVCDAQTLDWLVDELRGCKAQLPDAWPPRAAAMPPTPRNTAPWEGVAPAEPSLGREPDAEPLELHLKIDTGMGRMGALPDETPALVERIRRTPQLRLAGIYSHFATADWTAPDLVARQLDVFQRVAHELCEQPGSGVLRHLANSAATIDLPDAHFDMVRPGLALYGYVPCDAMAARIDLRPALRLVTHLTLVKELPAGHCVGYGRTFTTRRPTRLGLIPIGYADGFVRALSNAAIVGTRAGDAPVVGRVSMDQLAVDLTELPRLAIGEEVVLIDDDPARPNSVAAIARTLGTIPYEVTCLLGDRVERRAVDSGTGASGRAATEPIRQSTRDAVAT